VRKYGQFTSIDEMLQQFPYLERQQTLQLMKKVRASKGKITRTLLIEMCAFKTMRSKGKVKQNKPHKIRSVFRRVHAIQQAEEKCEILYDLKGVRVPTATAILMFLNPRMYPIIDTRVWQVLFDFGHVDHNEHGRSFSKQDYTDYLEAISGFSSKHHLTARQIDKILYCVHMLLFDIDRN
jgi:hypothetical protein